ncbi:MAG: hypothetical protein Q7S89_01440, partial [bacterium]|nr:hypothetical protein [bacterium]
KGAREMIQRHRPIIFLSVHPKHLAAIGLSLEVLAELIDSLEYNVFGHDGTPADVFALQEYILRPRIAPLPV